MMKARAVVGPRNDFVRKSVEKVGGRSDFLVSWKISCSHHWNPLPARFLMLCSLLCCNGAFLLMASHHYIVTATTVETPKDSQASRRRSLSWLSVSQLCFLAIMNFHSSCLPIPILINGLSRPQPSFACSHTDYSLPFP